MADNKRLSLRLIPLDNRDCYQTQRNKADWNHNPIKLFWEQNLELETLSGVKSA